MTSPAQNALPDALLLPRQGAAAELRAHLEWIDGAVSSHRTNAVERRFLTVARALIAEFTELRRQHDRDAVMISGLSRRLAAAEDAIGMLKRRP